jgi:hypothetical protein
MKPAPKIPLRPLAVDLFCGLGGFTEGLLATGWQVIGFDIERHVYGDHRYPAQLVLQNVLTLHGRQFKDVDLIVASPPCQPYSYRAMPWKRAKALPPPCNDLFDSCFRIQHEASAAAGRHIPMVVENVKGAQKWVGRARAHYGSFYLWGDVPALLPMPRKAFKSNGLNWSNRSKTGQDFTRRAGEYAMKNAGGSWFRVAHNTRSGKGQNPDGRPLHTPHMTNPAEHGIEQHGSGAEWFDSGLCRHGSKSTKRKFASAMIAKIPRELSEYIGRTFYPRAEVA